MVYREQLGIELPAFSGLACSSDRIAYEQAIGLRDDGDWVEAAKSREFDVLLFRVGKLFHSGILFNPRIGSFLHICKGTCVSVESHKSLAWKHRFVGEWRYHSA